MTGAGAAGLGGALAIVAVGSDVALAAPNGPTAVTTTRNVLPTSLTDGAYAPVVTPGRSMQLKPVDAQRSHWNA